jgi:nitronate monooxygenase
VWSKNGLVHLLKIRFPIVQAPMAGGLATPRLVAAVTNAGGLGSFGAGYLTPKEIAKGISEIRELTDQPFAVNLFSPSMEETKNLKTSQEALIRYHQELGIPLKFSHERSLPPLKEQIEVLIEEKIPVFSFTFGIPPLSYLQQLKKQKTVLIGTATTLEEALLLEESGVDAIAAQGIEAGGHRGTFLHPDVDPLLSTATLIALLSRHCQVPILAAGGIMNGAGVAAALALGAQGTQLGTAFIASPESGASPAYKKALIESKGAKTTLTACFTGKIARALVNRFTKEMQGAPIASYPIQHFLTQNMRLCAAKDNRPEFMALYAGEGFQLCSNLPAGEIVSLLVQQTVAAVQGLAGQIA